MTGRDLIVYILKNHLEDEPMFRDNNIVGLLSLEEAAVKIGTGVETVKALTWMDEKMSVKIGGSLFIIDKDLDFNEKKKGGIYL